MSGKCTTSFAGIVLSKKEYVGRDHLIHRKRSPFPYEGKALTPLKLGVVASVGRGRMLTFAQAGGAKPIAARDRDAGHLVGWVGGVPR